MCFNWRFTMNKNKIALGVIFATIITTLAYNQSQQPEQLEQSSNSKTVKDANKVILPSSNSGSTVISSSSAAIRSEVRVSEAQTASVSSSVRNQTNSNHLPRAPEEAADYLSSTQPKHHGHEHNQQRRHPEDGSLIPPGEPKKALPEQEDKS